MPITLLPLALGAALLVTASVARAADAPPPACSVTGANILAQDQGEISITCAGITEAFGRQLSDVLSRILQNRNDPQMVLLKLEEIERVPEAGVARTVNEDQKQQIIQNLVNKPTYQVAITAHLQVEDSADFARAIAAPLMMVGWQIDGNQIRRAAPKSLDPVHGLAIVVRDAKAPPPKAIQLKAALLAARLTAGLVADPGMAPDAALLWIGRRPVFMATEPPK